MSSDEYDRERVIGCMFDPTTSHIIAELEDGAKTCGHLARAASTTEADVEERLSYLAECGFVIKRHGDSGDTTFEADHEKLSALVEGSDGFGGAAVEGLEKMDSYLN